MNFITESDQISEYLLESIYVNFSNELIKKKAKKLFENTPTDEEKVRIAFNFVRDEIAHSWDIIGRRVTCSASDVLRYGEGICYAKSNLLTALLRAAHIPTGFCYQRLMLFDKPEEGYCIHTLNAVYIKSIRKWIRLDARGNKPGIHAEFSLNDEKLAFSINNQLDEVDYATIYTSPHPVTMRTLENHTDPIEMYLKHLPTEI